MNTAQGCISLLNSTQDYEIFFFILVRYPKIFMSALIVQSIAHFRYPILLDMVAKNNEYTYMY